MKKFLAALLALVMVLSVACFSLAETADSAQTFEAVEENGYAIYMTIGVVDAEGNVATLDGTEASVFLFAMNEETGECGFGSFATTADENDQMPENYVDGTYEVTEETDDSQTIVCTLSDGESITLTYDMANDAFIYAVADKNIAVMMMNLETLAEAAADSTAAN